jgi:IS1 family transposase
MRTLTYCRLVIAAPKFEGNHGPNLLEIAGKGHCYLQLNPKNRRERMGLSGKLTLEVGSTLLVQTCAVGDKWHLEEVVITIKGKQHWLWRAVDQYGYVLDVLVQSRHNTQAAERLMRKLLRKHSTTPRVMVTDKLKSYAAANRKMGLKCEHRQHKGLNNRAENSHQPTRVREKVMRRFLQVVQDFVRPPPPWLKFAAKLTH